ncbi:MAG TPA: DUF4340 domain-containing protein, partial [Candidatus Sulfomarinibacteraceae bacterium]|nr:DUF4340 domain-containing protein [Candidatus Sulfomarinibacteraceae bacterium]
SRQDDQEMLSATALPAPTQAPNPFASVSAGNVERLDIQLEATANPSASFRRTDDGAWHMTTPTATQVISSTLTNTIRTLFGTGSRRTIAPDENPIEAYGLDNPAQTLTFAVRRDQDLVQIRLLLGNSTPADDAYYTLKVGDPRIYLISKSALDNVLNLASNPPLEPAGAAETPQPAP